MTAAKLLPEPSDDDIAGLLAACGLKAPVSCGTVPGYMRHLSVDETPCESCRDVYEAARPAWASKPRRKRPIEHGTPKGARAHQRRHEAACGPCARAYRAYQTDQRAAKKKARAAA